MNEPSHDDISIAAHSLWKDRGCPEGLDKDIWLEAERQLRRGQTSGEARERARRAQAAAESREEYNLSASTSDEQAIRAAVQKPPPAGRGAQTKRASVKGGSGQAGLG